MNDKDDFAAVCGIYIEGFSMEAFDQQVAALEDAEFKAQLLEEREEAYIAFQSGNDDWLRARVQAMSRLLTLINFSEDARSIYRKQKEQTVKFRDLHSVAAERIRKRG